MKHWLLPEKGNFYKANLHTHTTLSDGDFSPEEIKEKYKSHGYSVVAYTDHDIFISHNDLCDKDFLALNSHEIEVGENLIKGSKAQKTYHLNFYAKKQDITMTPVFSESRVWGAAKQHVTDEMRKTDVFAYYSPKSINNLIRIANESNFFVCYNHPVWSLQNYADYGDLKGLWGVEVHNAGCCVDNLVDTTVPFDDLLRNGEFIFPLCTDDTHMDKDAFGGWCMICSESLTYDAIVESLLKGDFYSSTGPEIHELYVEDGFIHIKTDNVAAISVTSDWRYGKKVYPPEGEKTMNSAVISIRTVNQKYLTKEPGWENSYFRIEVLGTDGTKAYTRAFKIPEIMDECTD